jgi:hypothetical protein
MTEAGTAGFTGSSNNVLYCERVPATLSLTATKLTGTVAAGGSANAGYAVYVDADAGSELGEVVAAVVSDGGAGTNVTASGLSITVVAGTLYRVCYCTDNVLNAPPMESGHKSVSGTPYFAPMFNQSGTFLGHGANACVAGNPPATTGALTADDVTPLVLVLLEE